MSGETPDFFEDDFWDDPQGPEWQERDWQKYLSDASREVDRFVQIYLKTRRHPQHLDLTAHLMGWNTADWAGDDEFLESERGRRLLESLALETAPVDESEEPYTMHRHPVYVATQALFLMISRAFERELKSRLPGLPAIFAWDFSRLLSEGQRSSILATQAVDLGDLELAVIHFKQLLASVNAALGLVNVWEDRFSSSPDAFSGEARSGLFDLREIALRVIYECREEVRRPPADED